MEDLRAYLDSLFLGRDVMELMLRGKSMIDTRRGIPIVDRDAASSFLSAYGYSPENPVEWAELLGNYQESLRFIKKYFLRPENPAGADLEIPKAFYELADLRDLFIYAGDKNSANVIRSRWACAILRVMYTVSHIDKDIRQEYFASIQQQVFDRFYKELHSVDGVVYLGDPKTLESVELVKFQTKPRKARDSLILKLLHKQENTTEEVFDQVGVRFVTKSVLDVARVLKYLRDRYIVMPVNIRPNRSRNSLIDPILYRRKWREAKFETERGILHTRAEIDSSLEQSLQSGYEVKDGATERNRFSSQSYRSIQFTCRQLVKFRNPVYDDVKALRNALRDVQDPEIKKHVERLDVSKIFREQRFFYPFEVQILDLRNHEEAESGQASHAAYKAAQVQTAMKRVLGRLLE